MTTFRPHRKKEYIPERVDFGKMVMDLGLKAKLIEEALALERRTARPFKFQDPCWWLNQKTHWVLAFDMGGYFEFGRCEGNFWHEVEGAPPLCRSVYVLRSDGLYLRAYRRVYRYFRRDDAFSITSFSDHEKKALWKELGKPLRQRVVA